MINIVKNITTKTYNYSGLKQKYQNNYTSSGYFYKKSLDCVSFSANTQKNTENLSNIVKTQELQIKDNKEEVAIVINPKTGKVIDTITSAKAGEVIIPPHIAKGNIIIHNHPCRFADIVLGENDVTFAISNRAKEIRAITPSGISYSLELPDQMSKKDSNKLMDIYLEHFFSDKKYLQLRKQIKQDNSGNYLNSAEELIFISDYSSNLFDSMADKMQKQGYNVKYTKKKN